MFDVSPDDANFWFNISNAVLIFGAVLVAASTYGSIKFAGIKEKFSDERIAANEAAAKRAVADSDAAKAATAKADQRIAELSTQGERLRRDTAEANARASEAQLELERYKAPRTLSAEQQTVITTKLKKFGDIPFDLALGPMGDPEPLYLARSIHAALKLAGWTQVAWTGGGLEYNEAPMLSIGVTSVTNVIVDVHPDHSNKLGEAAKALAASLADAGVAAIADSKPTSLKSEAVHIRIGRKL